MAALAIVNPAAGGGRCRKLAPAALSRLRGAGVALEAVETRKAGDATQLAREAYARGLRQFIAVGGDGTTFEVLNGLFPQALPGAGRGVSLGLLPLGTGNSFLRDFTDRGTEHALEAIVEDRRRRCDAVRLVHDEGELFYLNLLSVGFVADVCSTANRRFKRLGAAGYGAAVVLQTARLSPHSIRMRLDGGEWRTHSATFVSLSNSRFTGGTMMMAPGADTADGAVDVVVAGAMGRLALLRAFPRIFAGTHMQLPALWGARASNVEFECFAPVDLMIDGEVVTHRPRRVEVLPAALEVHA